MKFAEVVSTSVPESVTAAAVSSLVLTVFGSATGRSLTGLIVIVTVLTVLDKAAVQVALTGLQSSGSPRSVTW